MLHRLWYESGINVNDSIRNVNKLTKNHFSKTIIHEWKFTLSLFVEWYSRIILDCVRAMVMFLLLFCISSCIYWTVSILLCSYICLRIFIFCSHIIFIVVYFRIHLKIVRYFICFIEKYIIQFEERSRLGYPICSDLMCRVSYVAIGISNHFLYSAGKTPDFSWYFLLSLVKIAYEVA